MKTSPSAYCEPCNRVGMSNCSEFDVCGNAKCITCKRNLDQKTFTDQEILACFELHRMVETQDRGDGWENWTVQGLNQKALLTGVRKLLEKV